jgi:hypothetical protein
LGRPLGQVLGKASVLMKDWDHDPNDRPDDGLGLEGSNLAAAVLASYGLAICYLLLI